MKYSWAFLPLDIKPSAAPHTMESELASQQTLGRSGRPPWAPTVPPVTVAGPLPPLCSAKGQGSSCCALPQPRGLPVTSATRQPSARCVGTSALELGSEGRAAATPHRRVPAPVCPGPPSQVRGGGTLPTSSFSTLVAEGSLPHANKTGLLESTLPLAVWWPAPPCSHLPSSVHTSVRALTHTLSAPHQVPCVEIRLRDVEQNHPSLALQVFTPAPPQAMWAADLVAGLVRPRSTRWMESSRAWELCEEYKAAGTASASTFREIEVQRGHRARKKAAWARLSWSPGIVTRATQAARTLPGTSSLTGTPQPLLSSLTRDPASPSRLAP
ncbi:uncharacterized protein LOC115837234 [Nomascus leucogenys]|uniref:uncharacterized protein LOC115837234 n=1 Tax=Nomascus leucogenys TaxID=61853 RepID=UPI00122D91E4|nr:uncharacterized protein LOC115837234 [Nomascus leucogenys]